MKDLFPAIPKLFFILVLLLVLASPSKAAEFIFTGTGDYTNASLWSPSYPGGQLGVGDTATISTGSVCTIPAGTFMFIQGALVNDGELISNNTIGAFGAGSIINNGYFHVFANIDNLGNIFNNGTIEAENTFSNQGEGILDNASGATIINKGTFVASSISGGSFNFEGTFSGGGTIHVQDYPNLGIIAPGFSPGILTFKNNLALDNSGRLEIEIAGLGGAGEADGHDQIIVERPGSIPGDLDIDGTLKVILLDDFEPEAGDQWIIATGNTSGVFSILDLPGAYLWEVDIQTDKIVLEMVDVNLPVALTNFRASQKDEIIQLDWRTSSEFQNELWEINRLNEKNEWENIGVLPGRGDSNIINDYQFKDVNPNLGLNYYRLTQIDFDGQKSYSPIVSVDFQNKLEEIQVYPNPTERMLYFSEIINDVNLYNLQGQNVFSIEMITQSLDLRSLDDGIYILKFKTEKEEFSKVIYIE